MTNRRRWIFWVLLVALLGLDQWLKAWTRGTIPIGGHYHGLPFPGIFELTLTYNQGVAFGKLQGYGVLMAPIAILIAVLAGLYTWRHPQESRWNHTTAGLLAAGALGNLYDRVFHGKVTDMLEFRFINFPVFNVADVCISVAAGMMIVTWIREAALHRKSAPSPAPVVPSE